MEKRDNDVRGGDCYCEVKPNGVIFNNRPNKGGEREINPMLAAHYISHVS